MKRIHPKKCPKCGSGRVLIRGSKFLCQRPGCNFENDLDQNIEVKTMNWKVK